VGASLRVDPVNRAHARLTWSATPDAAVYHVYRNGSPDGPFNLAAESESVRYEDPDVYGDGQTWYYLVRASDACGNEGP
jgi:hypothetical protein